MCNCVPVQLKFERPSASAFANKVLESLDDQRRHGGAALEGHDLELVVELTGE